MSASDTADVPAGVTTRTFTGEPAAPEGATAVTCESSTTMNDVAGVNPNNTAVAPVNPVPRIVTDVPPASGPVAGATAATAGTAKTGAVVRE
jgi:hypothetical protein